MKCKNFFCKNEVKMSKRLCPREQPTYCSRACAPYGLLGVPGYLKKKKKRENEKSE